MFNTQKLIVSGFPWLFAGCILPLCLTVPAPGTAASSADPAARAGDTLLISSLIDEPDIFFPKPPPPPPPPCLGTTAMERTA